LSLISTAGDGPTVSRRGPYRINFCDATDTERDALSLQQFNFSAETSWKDLYSAAQKRTYLRQQACVTRNRRLEGRRCVTWIVDSHARCFLNKLRPYSASELLLDQGITHHAFAHSRLRGSCSTFNGMVEVVRGPRDMQRRA